MKRSFRDQIKQRFHNRLVKIICALPKFQSGPIEDIQQSYLTFSKAAHEAREKRRPPAGGQIQLTNVRLVEVFDIDHHEMLTNGLRNLFPACKKVQEMAAQHEQSAGELSNGSWHKIGVITSSSDLRWIFFGERQKVEALPKYVEAIEVSLQSILPSLHVVSFDLHISESVSSKLCKALDAVYEPEFYFSRWWPLGRRVGYSINISDSCANRAYAEIIDELRLDAARWLSRYIRGIHFTKKYIRAGRVPATMAFRISGNPTDPEALKAWNENNRSWLNASYASSINPPFEAGNVTIMLPEHWAGKCDAPNRVLVRDMAGDSKTRPNLQRVLDGLTAYQAVNEYVALIRQIVEKARMPVYSSLAQFEMQVRHRALARTFEVQHCLHLLNRVKLELIDGKDSIAFFLMSLGRFHGEKQLYGDKKLSDILQERLSITVDIVRRHAENMENALSETINLQNIHVMVRLGRAMKALAIVGLVFSALQTAVYRHELMALVRSILDHVMRLF